MALLPKIPKWMKYAAGVVVAVAAVLGLGLVIFVFWVMDSIGV